MALYQIQAVAVNSRDTYDCAAQLPTFFLDGDVQGITSAQHATRVAAKVIDPFCKLHKLHLTAYCEDTGDYAAHSIEL
jgi:hypothetical protein